MQHGKSRERVPPQAYNKSYLLTDAVEGYEEFRSGTLSQIKNKLFDMLAVAKSTTLLEIGIGRGEFLRRCAKTGAKVTGIDYSQDAVAVARKTLNEFPQAEIMIADATNLPFQSNSFERVFAGDVIEHLCYEDGLLMLKEMYRVLKPGGFMLIHTSPNTFFTKFIYPLAKCLLKLVDKDTINMLDAHLKIGRVFHVCEYNLFSMRTSAKKAGLPDARVWIDKDILRSGKHRLTQSLTENPLIRLAGSCGRFFLVRCFLGNDLYLKCSKKRNDKI
jgi:ubiquinone/menaquinone biosynthesis C-methylase UbiE